MEKASESDPHSYKSTKVVTKTLDVLPIKLRSSCSGSLRVFWALRTSASVVS